MCPTPDRPASMESRVSWADSPSGVTAPRPVTTTRRRAFDDGRTPFTSATVMVLSKTPTRDVDFVSRPRAGEQRASPDGGALHNRQARGRHLDGCAPLRPETCDTRVAHVDGSDVPA